MTFLGRRIIATTLDPIPRSFRAVPGYLALNQFEIAAIGRNSLADTDTIKPIMEIVQAEDMADVNRTFIFKPRKVSRKTPKLGPSLRLFMVNTLSPGRRGAMRAA